MRDEASEPTIHPSRRDFLKLGTASALAAGLPALHAEQGTAVAAPQAPASSAESVIGMRFEAAEPRIGMIGTGGRGTSLLGNLLGADAKIIALCDVVPEHAQHAQSLVTKAGQPAPELYTKGDHDFERLVARDDINLVIIATPWDWHVPMAVASMQHGKHTAVEVPAATTLEDCWKLVNTSEKTRRHCMMLENCCYGATETTVLRMVKAGLFGDLLYGEGAYLHDLRDELFSNKGEGLWRRDFHTRYHGNLYPTHGLGPVANYMGIQRGDRFDYMVSMSSPERGLDAWRKAHLDPSDPRWKEHYITGDLNTSLIKTANGLTITLKHDTSNPRPYDRINQVAGTKGVFIDYPPRLYFDGQAGGEKYFEPDSTAAPGEQSADADLWRKYQHPLWEKEGEIAKKLGGHGGMDFIMLYRLLECVREGLAPDMDVYDAAAWSAPGPLSRESLANGSAPAKFPDFTRGKWKDRQGSPIAG